MKIVLKYPTFFSLDKKWRRRCYHLPASVRACLVGWVTILLVLACALPLFELDAFRNALSKVKLRSSSSQHFHEDTTNSGPHDLIDKPGTDRDFIDAPNAGEDGVSLHSLLLEPPVALDSSEERKTNKSFKEPPVYDASEEQRKRGVGTSTEQDQPLPFKVMELLKPPYYQKVMFVDTTPEERELLAKTTKNPNVEARAAENGKNQTKYELTAEALQKWKSKNVVMKWIEAVDSSTDGYPPVTPIMTDTVATVETSPSTSVPKTNYQISNEDVSSTIVPQSVSPPLPSTGKTNPQTDNVASQEVTPQVEPQVAPQVPILAPLPPTPVVKKKANFGYTEEISNNISITRDIPDSRHETCRKKKYENLNQSASVIISFYDEAWSVLVRTVHSVMERSPKHLLRELIIVDDHSDEELTFEWEELKLHVRKWNNVHLYRNEKREGLIRSRMGGTTRALGNVFVFLDSHVEVNKGWLEPLLARIAKDWHTIAVPVLDAISPTTFRYTPSYQIPTQVDAFRWDLSNFRIHGPKPPKDDPAGPLNTPIAAHGQFAVSKRFFDLLGGFDKELEILGGENLEMSLKAWMCGGQVELVPCSRVGHVTRGRLPSLKQNLDRTIQRNEMRVAKTWMGEHSVYFENSMTSLQQLEFGDISERIALKNRLHCKSFDWYLKTVYPQIHNPKEDTIADSEIRSMGVGGNHCLDAFSTPSAVAKMFPCHGSGGNQRFWYTIKGEIRRYEQCLDYWGKNIQFLTCHGLQGNQLWLYMTGINKIKHVNSNKCLTAISHDTVDVLPCEDDKLNQQWTFSNFNMTAYEDAGME